MSNYINVQDHREIAQKLNRKVPRYATDKSYQERWVIIIEVNEQKEVFNMHSISLTCIIVIKSLWSFCHAVY